MRRRDGRVCGTLLSVVSPVDLRAIGDAPFVLVVTSFLMISAVLERRLDVLVDGPLAVRPRHGQTDLADRTPGRTPVGGQQPPGVRLVGRIRVSRSASESVGQGAERRRSQRSWTLVRRKGRNGRQRGGGGVHGGQSRRRKRPAVIVHPALLYGMRLSVVGVAAAEDGVGGGVVAVCTLLRGGWPR